MKKTPKMILLSLALALMLPFFSLNAQTETFKQGDLVFSAGLGIGATYGTLLGFILQDIGSAYFYFRRLLPS